MVSKRLLIHDGNEDNQILNVDILSKYIFNSEEECQTLLSRKSDISDKEKTLKIASQLNPLDLTKIKSVAYLFTKHQIQSAESATFSFYRVGGTEWEEELVGQISGTKQSNNYISSNIDISALSPSILNGEDSLMLEVELVRRNRTYKDRVYLNHIGIYDSYLRLKRDVQFLEVTKLDE